MRTIIRNSVLLLAAVAMAAALSGDGKADQRDREPLKLRHGGQFNASGRHTGMLHGTIEVGGRQIQVTKNTKVYMTGKGFVDAPMLYGDAIYVMGDGGSEARMIIVRPLQRDTGRAGSDMAGKLPPDAEL